MQKLLIVAHPNLQGSIFNKNIVKGLSNVPNLLVRDLYALYPNKEINEEIEAQHLLASEQLIFQFPLYWYQAPSLMKAYQDTVLTKRFAVGRENIQKLSGKKMLLSVTIGNTEENYMQGGRIAIPILDLLAPWRACARYFDMEFQEPVLSYRCHDVGGELTETRVQEMVGKHTQTLKSSLSI